ncbi:SusC/RagA family TonB-linked outer membrane protein [Spirosoma endophyticum]|uniref:TonB-linked outer membrane protein, SusC/RagA family n=1 Tax=Spirosoma endophyticum TaxID=662367 RepID=A0A1I2CCT1_9BACT|nr:TonB-dependent receptor [Spirosoma endophyticum]SFE66131.1 TonB-linked outer membrane protein, SusC/RagA family [Spirosoma endophyticum]
MKINLTKVGWLLAFLAFIAVRSQLMAHGSLGKMPKAIPIKGTVTTETGETLPGVTIAVKGTTIGTTTNESGQYSLSIPDGSTVLVFSSVGYEKQDVSIGNRTTVNVVLKADTKALSEVVVVGYGTQQRRDLTGSVASVKGKELENLPVQGPLEAIQGRVAGVQIVQNSGSPGASPNVRIRGVTSLNAGNDPLYIVDGVPITGGINVVNPNDIQSMEVLKDASATAIYGARGANGIIIVTTKRGKAGKTSIGLSTYTGIMDVRKKVSMLNAVQERDYILNAVANAGVAEVRLGLDTLFRNGVPVYDTNWQDELYRQGTVSNYEVSLRGGNDKTTYAASLGYFNQKGIIISSGYDTYRGRFSIDHQASARFKTGANILLSTAKRDRVPEGDDINAIIPNAMRTLPFSPVYNPDGSYTFVDQIQRPNPVGLAMLTSWFTVNNRLVGNIYGDYDLWKGLTFRSTLNIDYSGTRDERFTPSTIQGGSARPGTASYGDVFTWVNENTLNYSHSIGKHSLSGLLGYSVQESKIFNLSAAANQGATDNITTLNAAASPTAASSSKSAWGLVSYFARLNYSFNDKYLLAATVRRDGSSRFGKDNQYGTFPSLSAGWRVSQESFMQGLSFINDLKLRASIGVVGNQSISDYGSQGLYSTGSNYIGKAGIALSAVPNPSLSWESTTQSDVGLDVSFLNNRITLTADAYLKKTNDLLLSVNLPTTSGFGSALQNVGNTQNKGLEFSIYSQNVAGSGANDFKWSTSFNISFNRNKIVSLSNNNADIIQTSADATFYGTAPQGLGRVGQPIGVFFGQVYTGRVYATSEEAKAANMRDGSASGALYVAGDMIYKDLNGDGIINDADRTIIGNANPKHTGGLTNNFSYKGFDLSIFLQWSYGNDIFNETREASNRSFVYNAATTEVLRSWRKEGDITDVPRGTPSTISRNGFASSRWVEDGSYLRVKTATLGYTFPSALLKRVKIENLRLYVSGQNLFTFTKYSGLDPEVNFRSTLPLLQGIDLGTYPLVRTLTFGLNLGF